jgi:hypothetical protein
MAEGSPPTGEKASARSLAIIALAGVAILVWVAVLMLRDSASPRRDSGEPVRRPAAPAARTDEPAPQDVDLERRIRDEVERALAPVRVSVPVVAPDGSPVRGARVLVAHHYEFPVHGTRALARVVRDDGSDAHVLDGVTAIWPRLPFVRVEADGCATAIAGTFVLPGGDVELDPIQLQAGGSLKVRVLDPGGEAAPGVDVAAWPVDFDPLEFDPGAASFALASGRTDGHGEIRFDHLGFAQVRVTAIAAENGLSNAFAPSIEVGGTEVTLRLERAESINGVAVEPTGFSINRFRMLATGSDPASASFDEYGGEALESGAFSLDRLAPGYYVIAMQADGCARATLEHVHTDVAALRVVLNALASANLEVQGAPGGLEIPVVWRPLAASGAQLRPDGPPQLAWLHDGELRLRNIPGGPHALELCVPGAMPIVTPVVEFALDATTELGSFTLEPGSTLVASVKGPDGRPLSARVALAAPHQTAIALDRDVFALADRTERICGKDGRLRWIGLPAGERVLAFRHRGFADRRVKISVPASGVLTLDAITLTPAGSIEGSLRTHGGRPLGGVEVTAKRLGGATVSAVTDLDGRFAFERLEPGRYEVAILSTDDDAPTDLGAALAPRPNETRAVDVAAGEVKRCDVSVESR